MIHSIKIDGDIDERLKEFNAKLPVDQKIISFTSNENYVFIQTEASHSRERNLLLEEYQRAPLKRG